MLNVNNKTSLLLLSIIIQQIIIICEPDLSFLLFLFISILSLIVGCTFESF